MSHEHTLQAKGFLVWGICALFFLYEFFLRTIMGSYQHAVMQDLSLTSLQFSLLSTTLFFLMYGGMQIPVGLIVDNIGLKKSMTAGALCCALSCIGIAYAGDYTTALIYRTLMGLGASFGFICLLISVHDWMPHKYSAIFIGLSQLIGTLGPMLAAGPVETLSHHSGISWRDIFFILSIVGVALVLLIMLFVENNHQKSGEYTILYKPEKIGTSFARLFSHTQPWFIAVLSACLYFTIEYLSDNEGRAFIMLKGISSHNAGYMITTAWVGYAIGCPLLGFLSDIWERRKTLLSISAWLAVISIILLLYSSHTYLLKMGFFMLGISAAGQSIGFALIAEQFKKQFVAVGFGLNNAILTLFSAVTAPTLGFLLDHTRHHGTPLSLSNYVSVFYILVVIACTALIVSLFFVKETYCKSAVDFTVLRRSKNE